MTDKIPLALTPQHLDIVANALGHRPYIEAAPVLDDISKQVAAYNASLPAATPADEEPAPALP